ncbi:MAG: hypothetical protein NT145_05775 [Elusimicrobia bacterium]|nr:hypothetical protein [Elusimicrobiota bacterium]
MEPKAEIKTNEKKAWVVSAMMGLGHMRAAYPLKDLAKEEILIEGSQTFCEPKEYKVWRKLRHLYYFFSKAEELILIGKFFQLFYQLLQQIPPYYPARDLSKPNFSSKYLGKLIAKSGLSRTLLNKIKNDTVPLLSTFYSSSIAVDMLETKHRDNYLVICDSDCNRVWVAKDPKKSKIKYIAPCTRIRKRLLQYGVPEERIFLTGFPLPKENVGSHENLEILKEDLYSRLVRLDPLLRFFSVHKNTVKAYLGKEIPKERTDKYFSVTFAVGGSGVQTNMALEILKSVKEKIKEGKLKVNLSAGISAEVYVKFKSFINYLELSKYIDNGINIIYDNDIYRYFDKFNKILRTTDVLWSKPSELTFYCALGIPILMAPSVGPHEDINSKWLQDIHAGVKPAGKLKYADEWLFDLREGGIFAEAAWDGFIKGRKLGTYKIEELIKTGKFLPGEAPLGR